MNVVDDVLEVRSNLIDQQSNNLSCIKFTFECSVRYWNQHILEKILLLVAHQTKFIAFYAVLLILNGKRNEKVFLICAVHYSILCLFY